MLLDSKLVYIPAPPEIEADMNEFGSLSPKLAAVYGEAAVQAGAPDWGEPEIEIADAIANILHFAAQQGLDRDDIDNVLQRAQEHYDAEREEAA